MNRVLMCAIGLAVGWALAASLNWQPLQSASNSNAEFCVLWIPHWSTCMTKSEWSGWTQGIGTVAAILGAFWIAERQRAKERQLREEDEGRKEYQDARTVLYMAMDAGKLITAAHSCLGGRDAIAKASKGEHRALVVELVALRDMWIAMPLQNLHAKTARHALYVTTLIRQFTLKVESAIAAYGVMQQSDFTDLFESMSTLKMALDDTLSEMAEYFHPLSMVYGKVGDSFR